MLTMQRPSNPQKEVREIAEALTYISESLRTARTPKERARLMPYADDLLDEILRIKESLR